MPDPEPSDVRPKRGASSPLPENDVDESGRKTRPRIKKVNLDETDESSTDHSTDTRADLPLEAQDAGELNGEDLPVPGGVNPPETQTKIKISLDDKVDLLSDKVDKILGYLVANKSELSAINKRNDRKFKSLESAHNEVVDRLDLVSSDLTENAVQVARNATNIEASETAIASLEAQLRICKATNEEYIGKFKDMTAEMKHMRTDFAEDKRAVLDLGLEVRGRRLVLTGVPELDKEEPITSALTACNKLLSHVLTKHKKENSDNGARPKFRTLKIADIDDAYRVGKPQKKKKVARGLVVTFSFSYIRKMVLSTKNYTKDLDTKCYVNEDLTQEARDLRASLKVIAESAQMLGHETKITGNKLIIDSEPYQPDELGAVSPTILQASKREKHLENGIAFRGDRSIFSNFFPAPMIVDDVEYSSVEQYFQYEKATQCGDENQARKIMNKSNPWYIKFAGKKVEETAEWKKNRLYTLHKGIFAKFDQNAPLKQALLNTAGLELYEATTDLFYACGIDLDSPKWLTGDWPGQNVTGKVLMKVRRELLEEDTLGNPADDNTLMNLSSTDEESEVNHDETAAGPMASVQALEMEIGVESQDWPELEKSLSFTEVVKSPNTGKITNVLPKLNKSVPQFTPSRGRGSNSRQRSTRQRTRFPANDISADDMAFLNATGKKTSSSQRNKQSGNRSNRGKGHTHSNLGTSTPNKPGIGTNRLSPKQQAVIKNLGFQPDSEFVRNAVSSRTKRN